MFTCVLSVFFALPRHVGKDGKRASACKVDIPGAIFHGFFTLQRFLLQSDFFLFFFPVQKGFSGIVFRQLSVLKRLLPLLFCMFRLRFLTGKRIRRAKSGTEHAYARGYCAWYTHTGFLTV